MTTLWACRPGQLTLFSVFFTPKVTHLCRAAVTLSLLVPPLRVLIAEDDEPIRKLLGHVCVRLGYDVVMAADGIEAMERIGGCDLLMLDLMMPRMNGFGVMTALTERAVRPVVVVLTAWVNVHMDAFPPGMVRTVIRKPFDLAEITVALKSIGDEIGRDHPPFATQ